MGGEAAVSRHVKLPQRTRSYHCEPCWIGRTVAAVAFMLDWILLIELWRSPGAPGVLWSLILFVTAVISAAVVAVLWVRSFWVGCAVCRS